MKKHTCLMIAGILLGVSLGAEANDQPLRNSAGQLSPIQFLNCGSESVNIGVEVHGNQADISLNDILRVYQCEGGISPAGASLNCTTSADDAPQKFGLHVGSSGKGTFSFSGNSGTPDLECSIHGI